MGSDMRRDRFRMALHFTTAERWRSPDLPIFVKGEVCYI